MPRFSNGIVYSVKRESVPTSKRSRMFAENIKHSGASERTMIFPDGEVTLILSTASVMSIDKAPRKQISPAQVVELVGVYEIAERLEVTTAAVSNWIARGHIKPAAMLHCGPVFKWHEVCEQRSRKERHG